MKSVCMIAVVALVTATAFGCVTGPMDGDEINNWNDNFSVSGHLFNPRYKACIYANDEPTGRFRSIGEATSSSKGYTLDDVTGYAFSTTTNVSAEKWGCILPLEGKAETFIKVQYAQYGCFRRYIGSQTDVPYRFVTGTNLSDCYDDAGNIFGMPAECGTSNSYVRVIADRPACAAECDDASDCTDGDVCEVAECNSNNQCVYSTAPNGTACTDGTCNGSDPVACYCLPPFLSSGDACGTGSNVNKPVFCQAWGNGAGYCQTGACERRCWNKVCPDGSIDARSWAMCDSANYRWYDDPNPGVLCSGLRALSCIPRN